MRAAVVLQREEELEAVCAAAALGRQVSEVVDVVDSGAGRVVEQVACGEREGGVEGVHVAAEQEGGCQRDAEHFVRVDGYAVCEVGACEAGVCVGLGEDDAAAPGAIDVQPEGVGFADGG